MRRFFLWLAFVSILGLVTNSARAGTAYPETVDAIQPNGIGFKLRMRGDEYFSWHETGNGYAIQKDADGYWNYARPAKDRVAFTIVAGARVGAVDPATLNLRKNDLPDRALLVREIKKQRTAAAAPAAQAPSSPVAPPPATVPILYNASVKNVVILACFSDHWDAANNTVLPTQGHADSKEYIDLFNKSGYSVDGAMGSVRDYFKEVSYDKLLVDSVVSTWVRLPQNEAYYGTNGTSRDTNWKQMAVDAVNAADAAGFDFSQGDGDGDGWVDGLTIIHSGHIEDYTSNPSTCIWSKSGDLPATLEKDGVRIRRAHTEGALRGAMTSTGIMRIGQTCHEMGHAFGLPDLYDPSYYTAGLGYWCLMATGSWNNGAASPAHLSAWAKCNMGFIRPVSVHSQTSISLPRVEDNPVVHALLDGTSNEESFLVENRAKLGFDNSPQIYPGILIYHVAAKNESNNLNDYPNPLVKIEEADGNDSLGWGTAYSSPGDVWTSTNGLAGGFHDQTGDVETNAMLYQSTDPYCRQNLAASYTYNRLSGFSAPGAVMKYTATALKATIDTPHSTSGNFTVKWAPCTNATKYELQEGASATITSFFDSAESEAAMRENWKLTGPITRVNSDYLDGSYSYSLQRWLLNPRCYAPQVMEMSTPFKMTAATQISYVYRCYMDSGCGLLRGQISNDNGATWKTLGSYGDWRNSWVDVVYSYPTLTAADIKVGDTCLFRLIATFESFGTRLLPQYGWVIDKIELTGVQIPTFSNWTTLGNNITATSFPVTGKTIGNYHYRVRAFVSGGWQDYGPVGDVRVGSYTLTYTAGTHGKINGATPQTVYWGDTGSSVSAVPDKGYHFVKWSDGSKLNPRKDGNITKNLSVTASFAADPLGVGDWVNYD